jgi:hypothetical protein
MLHITEDYVVITLDIYHCLTSRTSSRVVIIANSKKKVLHVDEPFLRSRQLLSYSRISQYFTKPEGSLPCSQDPILGLYPEPDECSPYHPILSL